MKYSWVRGRTSGVLHVADIERALVLLDVGDGSDTPAITSTSDHAEVAHAELDEVLDLASLNVQHHGVVHLRGSSTEFSTSGANSGDAVQRQAAATYVEFLD